MNRQITINQPARLEIGAGSVATVGAWAGDAQRVLVLTVDILRDKVASLGLRGAVTVYDDIPPEPDDRALERALDVAGELKPDLIIGLGGGSVMDIAKLVAVLWDRGQSLTDVIGPNKVAKRLSRLALIPTTAGTGSEAGIRALVTNSETQAKMAVESPFMGADLAVLDPELTFSVPAAVTAATGIDAMAHCVEAFTNIRAHDMIDSYARMGIGLVGKYLRRAVENGSDTEAREGMMLASYYGGICLGPVNTAAGHALAYPLGTRLHLPHGLANALIFPHVLAFNQPERPEKTAEVLSFLGLKAGSGTEHVSAEAHAFCASLGVDMKLGNHGATEGDLRSWAEEAHAIRRLMDNNPRDMSIDQVEAIYKSAL